MGKRRGFAFGGGGSSTSLSLIHPEALYDIDFARGKWYGALPSNLVVARASTALTLTSAAGPYITHPQDTARITGSGLMIEEARTNLFLNSTAPATQTITVVNGTTYTVGCFIAGSAALSGAGTGTATPGSPVTFTASSTSLTVTISGGPSYVNVSAASFSLSPIATTGTAATRPADVVYLPVSGVGSGFTLYAEFNGVITGAPRTVMSASLGAGLSNNARFLHSSGGALQAQIRVAGSVIQTVTGSALNTGSLNKVAASFDGTNIIVSANGAAAVTAATGTAPAAPDRLYIGGNSDGLAQINIFKRRSAVIPRAMSAAELQAITT